MLLVILGLAGLGVATVGDREWVVDVDVRNGSDDPITVWIESDTDSNRDQRVTVAAGETKLVGRQVRPDHLRVVVAGGRDGVRIGAMPVQEVRYRGSHLGVEYPTDLP